MCPSASPFVSLTVSFLIDEDMTITLALSISQAAGIKPRNERENTIHFKVSVKQMAVSIVMGGQDAVQYNTEFVSYSISTPFLKDSSALI